MPTTFDITGPDFWSDNDYHYIWQNNRWEVTSGYLWYKSLYSSGGMFWSQYADANVLKIIISLVSKEYFGGDCITPHVYYYEPIRFNTEMEPFVFAASETQLTVTFDGTKPLSQLWWFSVFISGVYYWGSCESPARIEKIEIELAVNSSTRFWQSLIRTEEPE